jgi:hypothetical protein
MASLILQAQEAESMRNEVETFSATVGRLLEGPSSGDQSWYLHLQEYVNSRVNNYYSAQNASSAGSVGSKTLSSQLDGEGAGLALFDHMVESLQLTPEDMVRLRALEKRFSSIQQNIADHGSSLEFVRSVSESAGIVEATTMGRSRSNTPSNATDDVSVSELRRAVPLTAESEDQSSRCLTTTAVRNIGFPSTRLAKRTFMSVRSTLFFFSLLVLSQAPFLALLERMGNTSHDDAYSLTNTYVREAYSRSFLLILTLCVGLLVPGGLEVVLLLAPRGTWAMVQYVYSKFEFAAFGGKEGRRMETQYLSMILDEQLLQLQMAQYKSTIILATILPYGVFVIAQILRGHNTEAYADAEVGELYAFIPVVHMQINVYFACFTHLGASNATPSGLSLIEYALGFASFSGLTFIECLSSIIDDHVRRSNSILVSLSYVFQVAFGLWLLRFFWCMLSERERARAAKGTTGRRSSVFRSVFKNTLVYASMFACLFILDLMQQYNLLPLNGLTAAVILRTCLAVVFFFAPFHFHLAESNDYDSAFKDVLLIAEELNNTSSLEEGGTLSLSSQGGLADMEGTRRGSKRSHGLTAS